MLNEQKRTYIVKDNIKHSPDVSSLKLILENGDTPPFHHGQYITIYFPEVHTLEGKAYTISNTPQDSEIEITVKKIGLFSEKLRELQIGDTLLASDPYGYFYTEETDSKLVCIAGGIGITPFMSIARDMLSVDSQRTIDLLWSVKKQNDFFTNIFSDLSKNYPHFNIRYFITRENFNKNKITYRRINLDDIKEYVSDQRREYFLCGSIGFVRDMWKLLRSIGISEDKIYTESFFN